MPAFQTVNFCRASLTMVFPWTARLGIYFLKQLFNADITLDVHGFLVAFYLTIDHLTLCKVQWTILRATLKLKTIPPNPD